MPCEAPGTAITVCETERSSSVGLMDFFQLTVLGTNDAVVDCRVHTLVGRRLIARLSTRIVADACIRIDCNDAALYGEVFGCWQEGASIFGAIELRHALTGLSALAAIRQEFENPAPLQVAAHQLTA